MSLSRDDILAADDLPMEEVEVPEWGGSVFVRSMTGAERDEFEAGLLENKTDDKSVNLANMRARLTALCAVDENGERLFTKADAEALGKKSAAALDKVFGVAQELNGMRAEDVEELAGN